MKMKLFVFILILFISKSLAEQNCLERQIAAEELVKLVFRAQSVDQKIIENDQDFEQFCLDGKAGLKKVKDFSACLNGVAKQFVTIVYSNAVKAIKKYCVQDVKSAKNFLYCFDEEKIKDIQQCVFRFSEAASYAEKTKIESEIIPGLCCGYVDLNNCIETTHQKQCKVGNTTDAINFDREFRQSMFGPAIDLLCLNFRSETCQLKEKSLMKKIKSYGKKNPVNLDNFSLVNKLRLISEKLTN